MFAVCSATQKRKGKTMMDGLAELYQELILDHNARPRNFGALPDATHSAEGLNPLCGDQITIYMTVAQGVLTHVAFTGQGCAISKASASLMTDQLMGKTLAEAQALFGAFHTLLAGSDEEQMQDDASLGKLLAFSGVRVFPMRVKCATLAWHTLQSALKNPATAAPITKEE
jgi:nitrogen fixation NifU-like protein